MKTRRGVHRAIPLLLLFVACESGGDGGTAGFATRDSAGIHIAESSAPAWREGEGWTLGAAPSVEIGVVEGAPEYQLGMVTGALRLASGNIAISNATSQDVRFYDPAGAYLRSVGGRGGGPGEFKGLGPIQALQGDSLFAFDILQQRLSIFSPAGDFVRSAQMERTSDGGLPFAAGVLEDGSVIARVTNSNGGASQGLQRSTETYLRYSGDGKLRDTVTVQAGAERFIQSQSGEGGMMRISMTNPLFGHSRVVAVGADRVVFGGNERYELAVYTPEGVLERLVRRRQPARPVTAEALDALLKTRLDRISDPARRQQMQRTYAEIPHSETMPFYEAVMLDDESNLWVREFQPPPAGPPLWTVFDADGRMLGAVSMSDDFRPTQIGRDFVLGIWNDDMDVQHVRMYALEKHAH